jgi:glycosyltransferase involved in cell wall biosynthesis
MHHNTKIVLLVADVRGWAFDSIAQYVKSIISDQYDCHVIYTSDSENYEDFLESLGKYTKIDFIHFFYRGYLHELLNTVAKHKNQEAVEKFLNAATTTNIPDHLFIDSDRAILDKLHTFSFLDNYYPVSQKLHDIYSNIDSYPKPWKVIYDNIAIPEYTKTHDKDKLAVTWIGNSAWGDWYFGQGYDSKGFKTVVLPIFELIKQELSNVETYIADAVTAPRTKAEIIEILRKTDIVILGAKTDGTPLPAIEGMAYGCAIISTDIGIVSEILPQIQQEFIVPQDPALFLSAIKRLDNDQELLSKLKEANITAHKQIFKNDKHFKVLWSNLIEDSIKKLRTEDRIKIKKTILKDIQKTRSSVSIFGIKRLIKKILPNQMIRYFL